MKFIEVVPRILISITFIIFLYFIYLQKKGIINNGLESEELDKIKKKLEKQQQLFNKYKKMSDSNIKLDLSVFKKRIEEKTQEEKTKESVSIHFEQNIEKKESPNINRGGSDTDAEIENYLSGGLDKDPLDIMYTPNKTKKFFKDEKPAIVEYDKTKFSFSIITLIKGCFLEEGNYIYEPISNKVLIKKQDFFMKFQTGLNDLVKRGIYQINYESLKIIKKSLQIGEIKNVIDTLYREDIKNGYSESYTKNKNGELEFFKTLTLKILNINSYKRLEKEDLEKYNKKKNDFMVVIGKLKSKTELTTEDKNNEILLKEELVIKKEIQKVVGKEFANIIFFEKERKTVYLQIDINNIFNKKMKKLIEYFNKNKTKIIFYI